MHRWRIVLAHFVDILGSLLLHILVLRRYIHVAGLLELSKSIDGNLCLIHGLRLHKFDLLLLVDVLRLHCHVWWRVYAIILRRHWHDLLLGGLELIQGLESVAVVLQLANIGHFLNLHNLLVGHPIVHLVHLLHVLLHVLRVNFRIRTNFVVHSLRLVMVIDGILSQDFFTSHIEALE